MSFLKRLRQSGVLLMAASLVLSGCIRLPGTQYIKYTIDLTIGNRPYSFSRFFQCSRRADLSEADNSFHIHWESSDYSGGAARISPNSILLYTPVADCEKRYPHELKQTVQIWEKTPAGAILYVIRNKSDKPLVVINRIHVENIDSAPVHIGPSEEEATLSEAILKDRNRNFQRVTANVQPYEVWATSDHARSYFSQFTSVAVAKVGEAPPMSGWPDSFVEFPYYKERRYGPQGTALYSRKIPFTYNGTMFVLGDGGTDAAQTWYSVDKDKAKLNREGNPIAIVDYKGTVIQVNSLQEIYDPATKEILLLENQFSQDAWNGWGAFQSK